ncbi:hypothetical protein XU18_2751 [Perkinsela sp. CCAP 1560/4]|nr:hypothetical protein XU18_2751 [Perkinsela sp. CCAP 1560/4]|eukprot:KNH06246.1 hypothetical protein XU18_2751 [Perkinsela sp. CCAP 1560/4]
MTEKPFENLPPFDQLEFTRGRPVSGFVPGTVCVVYAVPYSCCNERLLTDCIAKLVPLHEKVVFIGMSDMPQRANLEKLIGHIITYKNSRGSAGIHLPPFCLDYLGRFQRWIAQRIEMEELPLPHVVIFNADAQILWHTHLQPGMQLMKTDFERHLQKALDDAHVYSLCRERSFCFSRCRVCFLFVFERIQ